LRDYHGRKMIINLMLRKNPDLPKQAPRACSTSSMASTVRRTALHWGFYMKQPSAMKNGDKLFSILDTSDYLIGNFRPCKLVGRRTRIAS